GSVCESNGFHACWPSSPPRLIPPAILSTARSRNPSLGIEYPADNSRIRSCKETSGISPSTYRTRFALGADQRRRLLPLATARPIDKPSQLLPIPLAAIVDCARGF